MADPTPPVPASAPASGPAPVTFSQKVVAFVKYYAVELIATAVAVVVIAWILF